MAFPVSNNTHSLRTSLRAFFAPHKSDSLRSPSLAAVSSVKWEETIVSVMSLERGSPGRSLSDRDF